MPIQRRYKYGFLVASAIAFTALFTGSAGEHAQIRRELPRSHEASGSLAVKAILSGVVQQDIDPDQSDSGVKGKLVKAGQKVAAGQVLAVVESALGKAVTARAPADGIVSAVLVKPGARVYSGDVLLKMKVSR